MEIVKICVVAALLLWCQKAYINIGTFRKEMSIHFGTVYQSFFVVSKSVYFRTKERSE